MKLKALSLAVILAGVLVAGSCSPLLQDFYVDVKIPGNYNLPVYGKTIAVFSPVYHVPEGDRPFLQDDSATMSRFSIGIARGLEQNLGLREGEVPTFTLDESNLYLPDSLLSGIMYKSSISDFVILVDNLLYEMPQRLSAGSDYFQDNAPSKNIYIVRAYISARAFDKFGTELPPVRLADSVFVELGREEIENLDQKNVLVKLYDAVSFALGRELASNVIPRWQQQIKKIYVYYTPEWADAYRKALAFDWDNAVKAWMSVLNEGKNSSDMNAAAAYNIALSCELTDRDELAIEWLDYSYKLSPKKETLAYKNQILRKIEEKK